MSYHMGPSDCQRPVSHDSDRLCPHIMDRQAHAPPSLHDAEMGVNGIALMMNGFIYLSPENMLHKTDSVFPITQDPELWNLTFDQDSDWWYPSDHDPDSVQSASATADQVHESDIASASIIVHSPHENDSDSSSWPANDSLSVSQPFQDSDQKPSSLHDMDMLSTSSPDQDLAPSCDPVLTRNGSMALPL